MLSAIRNAKKSITFESYIYWSGKIGAEFAEALAECARAGIKVHTLIDWLGSHQIENSYFMLLRKAVAQIKYYHPLYWYNIFRMNNRTHRKILVVDGIRGFTGGVGISDDWQGAGDNPNIWRDSHYRGQGIAKVIKRVFVPDEVTIEELIKAKTRGVKIQIIVPGPYSDSRVVIAASRALWGKLLAAGIEMYGFQPAKFHCKVLIADQTFVSVGSTNFDDRSFRLNDEANLIILDATFAALEMAEFNKDLKKSSLVTLSQWEKRPWDEKLMEKFSTVLQNQL